MRHPFRSVAFAATAALLVSASVQAEPVTYQMDPGHTNVVVTWSHFGYSQPSAMFNNITGTIVYDAENPANSSVTASIPVASVHTASAKLDEHLQNDDFFNEPKWPNVTFESTKVVAGDDPDELKVTGDLTIHGVTKPVTLDVTINKVGERHGRPAAAFNAEVNLKRSNFGVGLYAPMVSDTVQLEITTEALAPEAAEAEATEPGEQAKSDA